MLKRMCAKSPFVPKVNDVAAYNKACVDIEKQNLGTKHASAQLRWPAQQTGTSGK